jgi:hypothetical protein
MMIRGREPFDIAEYSTFISNKKKIPQSPENLKIMHKRGLKFLKKRLEKWEFKIFEAKLHNLDPNGYQDWAKEFANTAKVKEMDIDYLYTLFHNIIHKPEATKNNLMKLWTKAMYTIAEKAKELNEPYVSTSDFTQPSNFGVENTQRVVVHDDGRGRTRGETFPVGNVMKYI